MNTTKKYNYSSIIKVSKLIRFDQWSKNILIFIPILASGQFEKLVAIEMILSFLTFSFAASFVYILNDIRDIDVDRKHPTKKNRILASKQISIFKAYIIGFFFFVLSIKLSLDFQVLEIILLYYFINFLYNFYLKKLIFIDVICLSSFYIIRIYFGGEFFKIEISHFLTAFSFLIFLILAIIKRLNEVEKYKIRYNIYNKNYTPYIKKVLKILNIISTAILINYIFSEEIEITVINPQLLLIAVPLIYIWNDIIINKATNGILDDDIIKSILKDIKSLSIIGITFLVIILSQIQLN